MSAVHWFTKRWTACCEIFVNMCKYTTDFVFLTTLPQAAATVTNNSRKHS